MLHEGILKNVFLVSLLLNDLHNDISYITFLTYQFYAEKMKGKKEHILDVFELSILFFEKLKKHCDMYFDIYGLCNHYEVFDMIYEV